MPHKLQTRRIEQDGETWLAWMALDSRGRPVAAVRIPERLADRGNTAMAGAFCEFLVENLAAREGLQRERGS